MVRTIDLNSDMGESFGRWQLGNDAELMEVITSANIACGWHGGDPAVMRTTVELAVDERGRYRRPCRPARPARLRSPPHAGDAG